MFNSSPAIPFLPNEIWSRIAFFVPRMAKQPSWQAWIEYRSLNKTFKNAIEVYYIEQYLKETIVHVGGGVFCLELGYIGYKLMLTGRFLFDGFNDTEKRVVVFREKEVHKHFARIFTHEKLANLGDPDFNLEITILVCRELTAMLPMDLKADFNPGNFTFKFDWRTYFCTFFDEQKRLDAPKWNPRHQFTRVSPKISTAKSPTVRLDMLTAMHQPVKAIAGSTALGDDNRLLRARRKRRVRIGLKSQEWLREEDAKTHDWYGKFDEELVVKQVQALQMGANFEQFSDEESDGNDKDGSQEDGTGDDEGESD